ncbi:hypothetical protein R1flu_006596 [Riccia fluitans]|uniref:Uncharacterized protein n=1 Tax=Riccia fluitans TaxID=41844 RepID=A0ABD1YWG2_9MARC
MVGRCCTPGGKITPLSSYLHVTWVCRPLARMYVRLLGPCFKMGRMKSPLCRHSKHAGVPEGACSRRGTLFHQKKLPSAPRWHRLAMKAAFYLAGEAHANQHSAGR